MQETSAAPTVLLLTDFSEASNDALIWADRIAKDRAAKLKVIYPYRLTQLTGKDDLFLLKKGMEAEAESNFAKLTELILKQPAARYEFKAEVGFINDRVYSHTRRNEILLVVISKRMASNNKEAFNEMMDHLRTPILVVPHHGRTDAHDAGNSMLMSAGLH